jgi:hypothetical protein
MVFDYRTALGDDFSRFCFRPDPTRNIISELEGGYIIIRILDEVVIKYGIGITKQEVDN